VIASQEYDLLIYSLWFFYLFKLNLLSCDELIARFTLYPITNGTKYFSYSR
jgi:hypothetical protein